MSEMQSDDRNETCKGLKYFFLQNLSLLMCFCNFVTEYCFTLKTQSVRHVIELMLKVQISPFHPTSNTI